MGIFFSNEIAISRQSSCEYLYNSELKCISQFQWDFLSSTMVIIDDKTIYFTRFEHILLSILRCYQKFIVLKTSKAHISNV